MKWLTLALLFVSNDVVRPTGSGGTSAIVVTEGMRPRQRVPVDVLGYPCNNVTSCRSCRICCLEVAGRVRAACSASGGTDEYCNDQFENTDNACRQEDCPSC